MRWMDDLPTFSDQCFYCKHWRRDSTRTCAAFPDGIPLDLWDNSVAHHAAYVGDHGIRFTPIEPQGVADDAPDAA